MVATNGSPEDGLPLGAASAADPNLFDPAVDTALEDDMPMLELDLDLPPLSDATWLRLIANALDPDAPTADPDLIPDMSALPIEDELVVDFDDGIDDLGNDADLPLDADALSGTADEDHSFADDWHHGAEPGGPDDQGLPDAEPETSAQDDDGWLS